MVLFDYLIGRKYRGLDYCLISKVNEQSGMMHIEVQYLYQMG